MQASPVIIVRFLEQHDGITTLQGQEVTVLAFDVACGFEEDVLGVFSLAFLGGCLADEAEGEQASESVGIHTQPPVWQYLHHNNNNNNIKLYNYLYYYLIQYGDSLALSERQEVINGLIVGQIKILLYIILPNPLC